MSAKVIISIFDSIPLAVMVVPILMCSVVLLAVMIERSIFYRKINIDYRLIMESVSRKVAEGRMDDALTACSSYSGPVISMIENTVKSWNPGKDQEFLVRNESEKSIISIEKYGGVVSTIGTISPMLGLLGTVTGMMKSFSAIASLGPSAQDLLAGGITEALITTALGLLVAIPAITFYNYMVSKVEFFVREVESIANVFIDVQKDRDAESL